MTLRDSLGHELSGASARSVDLFEQAGHEFRCYVGDPVATLQQAIADSPGMTMAHAMLGYLNLLGTEPGGFAPAREALAAAQALPATAREAAHVQAITHLAANRWHAAGRVLEDLSVEHPTDALALQAGHLVDFYTGHSRMLRDRIARAAGAWSAGMPGYHNVLAMHAFGLEENGEYARAESLGRRAVELEPRDGWGQHAVAHVLEMQNRRGDGVRWMRANPAAWSEGSFFAVHNWWHLALFHLGLGEVDEVLALYDGPIAGAGSAVLLDMVDASALLWRLALRGVDVGERWQAVAERWAPVAQGKNYAFNDWHAVMAFVGAGRFADAEAVLAAQQQAVQADDDNAAFTREVGAPVARAFYDFGRGDHAAAVDGLRAVRSSAHRFGGSHAQRDLIDLTLIEAASRAGQSALADALARERAEARGTVRR